MTDQELPPPPKIDGPDQTGVPEWKQWSRSKSPADLSTALKSMSKVIDEVPRANPKLSPALLRGQARTRTIEALSTFDPKHGASLMTHVRNHLKPLTMRSHGQSRAISRGRFVEETATEYKNAATEFLETHGREPTANEMADKMKIGLDRAKTLMGRSESYEIAESQLENMGMVPGSEDTKLNRWMEYIYSDMTPRDQLIMDYRLGRNGKPKLGLEEIGEKMNLSTVGVHKILNRAADRIMVGIENSDSVDRKPDDE